MMTFILGIEEGFE